MTIKSIKAQKKEELLNYLNHKISLIRRVLKQNSKIKTLSGMVRKKAMIYMDWLYWNLRKTTSLLDTMRIIRKMGMDIITLLMV